MQAEAEEEQEPRRPDKVDRTDIEEVRAEYRADSPIEPAAAEPPVEIASESAANAGAEVIATAEDTGDRPTPEPPPIDLPPEVVEPHHVAAPHQVVEPHQVVDAGHAIEPEPRAQAAAITGERLEGPFET